MDSAPAGSQGKIVKFEGEIKRQAERVVFMEEGYPSPDAFIVAYDREQWLDKPQAPHIKGVTGDLLTGTRNSGDGRMRERCNGPISTGRYLSHRIPGLNR